MGDNACPFDVWILGDNRDVRKRFQNLLVTTFKVGEEKTQLMTRQIFNDHSQELDDANSTVRVVIVVPCEGRQTILKRDAKGRSFYKEIDQIDQGKDQDRVMIVVYHEGVDDKLCCSAEAGKRFAAGGQKDLQKYIDSDRLLTLKRDSPINSEQSTAIANFLQVDAVPTINSEQSTVIANFPRVDAVTTTDELFTGHKDEPITDQPLSQTQPPKVDTSTATTSSLGLCGSFLLRAVLCHL